MYFRFKGVFSEVLLLTVYWPALHWKTTQERDAQRAFKGSCSLSHVGLSYPFLYADCCVLLEEFCGVLWHCLQFTASSVYSELRE